MIKSIFIFCTIIVFNITLYAQTCPIIPMPAEAQKTNDRFVLSRQTQLYINDPILASTAAYLQLRMLDLFSIPLTLTTTMYETNIIELKINNNDTFQKEEYKLSINNHSVRIVGNSVEGVVNGIASLLQLAAIKKTDNEIIVLDGWLIKDKPLYTWRGLMLDESRHFFGINKVKSILDWMAFYKLNRFHWHLTDVPGWRIEIKKYPRLALVGGIGTHTNPNVPAQFYTQQQIAEIVQYATQRNIMIIPEIDMPGHATAANKAYPQYNGGGSAQYPDFTFHPGKDSTYSYLNDILKEVRALFPSGLLHLGGDEVKFGSDIWLKDARIKNLMERNKMNTVQDVEQYFMQRMADSVFKMNAKLLAWDEVATMNFPKDKTIIFWWRHDKPQQLSGALNKGYQVVLCPRLPLYFDFVQDSTHTLGRKWGKAYSPLKDVYNFDVHSIPVITTSNQKNILGIQANVWSETITDTHRLDYMLYPRIAALAEAAWTPKEKKNYTGFTNTLQQHMLLYNEERINYYNPFIN